MEENKIQKEIELLKSLRCMASNEIFQTSPFLRTASIPSAVPQWVSSGSMLIIFAEYSSFKNPTEGKFAIDSERSSQAQFIPFQGQKNHEDTTIIAIREYLKRNYHTPISLKVLFEKSHVSERNLIRRFKQATYNTPNQYLQRVKIDAAKRQLENGSTPIHQVMYDAGYSASKSFREIFRKLVSLSSQQYRLKYGRMIKTQAT